MNKAMPKRLTNGWPGLINHTMIIPTLEKPIIQDIVYRHAEDAAFLWLQRDRAVRAADTYLEDIQTIDQKIRPHVNGLQVAGLAGWQTAWEALQQFTEPGEMFVASVVALTSVDESRLQQLLTVIDDESTTQRGLLSACAWCEEKYVIPVVKRFFQSESPQQHEVGIAACALRRTNPGDVIRSALTQQHLGLQVRALRAVGELGLREYAHHLQDVLAHQEGDSHFWAAWSLVLLGDRGPALEQLCHIMQNTQHPHQSRALSLAIRALSFDHACYYLNQMGINQVGKYDELLRQTIDACGTLGAPECIPWLIQCMGNVALARAAGAAFSRITGVLLDQDGLKDESPCIDSDDDDRDSDYQWPDANKIERWWQSHQTIYEPRQRYLSGQRLDREHMLHVLEKGTQLVRRGAAMDLMLSGHHTFLYNTSQS